MKLLRLQFKAILSAFTVAVLCSGLFGCASQKDVIILDERLMMLERQNQELQKQNSDMRKLVRKELEVVGESSQTTESALRSKYAILNTELDTLQENLQLLSGRFEEIEHQLQQKLEVFEKGQQQIDEMALRSAKIDKRLLEIEQYLNIGDSGAKPANKNVAAGGAGQRSGREASASQLYGEAKQAYDNGKMDKARQGFQQLIKAFPKSNNADNAQFWIGESYYREKWYEKAILEYQTVIEKYPKGNKVPAAMLKQGMSFLQLGDKSNARLILKELERKYPKSNEAKVAAKKLKEF